LGEVALFFVNKNTMTQACVLEFIKERIFPLPLSQFEIAFFRYDIYDS
jgi:hypothetical protein